MRSLRVPLALALLVVLVGCGGAPSSLFHSAGYYVRGDTVYYLDAFPGEASKLPQADAKTFTILDTTYAKDKNAVYLDGVVLPDADPGSFGLLEVSGYSKDATHVFMRDRVLSEDPDHFTFLNGDGGVTKDSAHVYWSDGTVLSDDPQHFAILSQDGFYLFAKDGENVFVNGTAIKDADPGTFKVERGAYGKDSEGVFYFTGPVHGADSSTFKVLDGPYARDDAHAYWMGKVVPGADPATFVVLNADFECTADSAHAFYRDVLIKGFDPSTIPSGATVTNCSETSVSFS
ncbi:DKNYY domain-containing protein [Nocardioides marmorisolisilvae]|uniref:DKNYY domain-containing protein n=1 Tax=Nocardioides marmorisolisilvae TaxID=1542737 RepID=UPI001617CD85|nr:DKNYY domain-containing protein [Nocardioides marmorisolisilvae]